MSPKKTLCLPLTILLFIFVNYSVGNTKRPIRIYDESFVSSHHTSGRWQRAIKEVPIDRLQNQENKKVRFVRDLVKNYGKVRESRQVKGYPQVYPTLSPMTGNYQPNTGWNQQRPATWSTGPVPQPDWSSVRQPSTPRPIYANYGSYPPSYNSTNKGHWTHNPNSNYNVSRTPHFTNYTHYHGNQWGTTNRPNYSPYGPYGTNFPGNNQTFGRAYPRKNDTRYIQGGSYDQATRPYPGQNPSAYPNGQYNPNSWSNRPTQNSSYGQNPSQWPPGNSYNQNLNGTSGQNSWNSQYPSNYPAKGFQPNPYQQPNNQYPGHNLNTGFQQPSPYGPNSLNQNPNSFPGQAPNKNGINLAPYPYNPYPGQNLNTGFNQYQNPNERPNTHHDGRDPTKVSPHEFNSF